MFLRFFVLSLHSESKQNTLFIMKKIILMIVAIAMTTGIQAEKVWEMEPLKLQVPEMKPELVQITEDPIVFDFEEMAPEPKMDFDFFKQKTNLDVKPYKVMDDLTFVGIPIFAAGWAIKGDKAMFRVNDENGKKNTQLLTDFKTSIDDYTQYFGPALTVGLKLGGYEGRSDWPRFAASAAMSYGIMAALVNGIKYTAKEMRPDGSTANSWPSGHTATSFVGATILHKEYGLTRSPWFSVAGYGVATATGVMRVLNNRHWVSDVLSGAGIGIMSTELAYALSDVFFKGKGLLRNDLVGDINNPSFFSISMGLGLGGKNIGFDANDVVNKEAFEAAGYVFDGDDEDNNLGINFRAATVVDAEGAYFINKYVGFGGRLRVRAMSAKSFGQYADISSEAMLTGWDEITAVYSLIGTPVSESDLIAGGSPVDEVGGIVRSDHLTEFTGSAGIYFNIPLCSQLALGTKLLVGRSITQELDIDGYAKGHVKNINYQLQLQNGDIVGGTMDKPVSTGQTYDTQWNYMTLGANNSTSWGTGISLTYRYKSNFAWKLFLDYDLTEKTYTLNYDPYGYLRDGLTKPSYDIIKMLTEDPMFNGMELSKRKNMHYFTLGASFAINF